jgi:hypothetical protein
MAIVMPHSSKGICSVGEEPACLLKSKFCEKTSLARSRRQYEKGDC